MKAIFPDLLRAIITDLMLVLLISTMATPKYKSKLLYGGISLIIVSINVGINSYFYMSENYTAVFYADLFMLIMIGVLLKPLFKDRIMQWCFSFITLLNIYLVVVFFSYVISSFLPVPTYMMVLLRFVFFSGFIYVFRKKVSTLYRNVLDYWHIFILPITTLLTCFLAFFFSKDIEEALNQNHLQFMLLFLLGVFLYASIINALSVMAKQYAMREENQKMQAEQEYLQLAASNMVQRLELIEEASAQNIRMSHDRRHFNNLLLELLDRGKVNEAIGLLGKQNQSIIKTSRTYCENCVVNAAVNHYVAVAEQVNIHLEIALEIPRDLSVDALELSMVISNLMENAIQACTKIPHDQKPTIKFYCRHVGRLLIELENSCPENIILDENGYPIRNKETHGIGTKSIVAFSKKYDGELLYKIDDGIFRVRLLV